MRSTSRGQCTIDIDKSVRISTHVVGNLLDFHGLSGRDTVGKYLTNKIRNAESSLWVPSQSR